MVHHPSHSLPRLGGLLLAAMFILACGAVATPAPASTQTPFVVTATALEATAVAPTITTTDSPAAPTSTSAPTCTVLQDLNLRPGPGTAYNPPIIALEAGTEFLPIGFNPVGIPGGTWVQARVDSINRTGWVSAGAAFVTCDLDLTSLPEVAVAPPPKPTPPRISAGAVDGDNISAFRFSLEYGNESFVRMLVFRSDDPDEGFTPSKDGRGVDTVQFIVTSPNGDRTFYQSTEGSAGYCIFGGGTPECNPWTFENGEYKWGPGGELVTERDYELTIIMTADDGQVGTCIIPINLRLP